MIKNHAYGELADQVRRTEGKALDWNEPMSEKTQAWITPGATVIEWASGRFGGGRTINIVTIDKVATKSFTVNAAGGGRYPKDTLSRRVGGAYGTTYRIEPLDTPLARELIAERRVQQAEAKILRLTDEFRRHQGQDRISAAAELRSALARYLQMEAEAKQVKEQNAQEAKEA